MTPAVTRVQRLVCESHGVNDGSGSSGTRHSRGLEGSARTDVPSLPLELERPEWTAATDKGRPHTKDLVNNRHQRTPKLNDAMHLRSSHSLTSSTPRRDIAAAPRAQRWARLWEELQQTWRSRRDWELRKFESQGVLYLGLRKTNGPSDEGRHRFETHTHALIGQRCKRIRRVVW